MVVAKPGKHGGGHGKGKGRGGRGAAAAAHRDSDSSAGPSQQLAAQAPEQLPPLQRPVRSAVSFSEHSSFAAIGASLAGLVTATKPLSAPAVKAMSNEAQAFSKLGRPTALLFPALPAVDNSHVSPTEVSSSLVTPPAKGKPPRPGPLMRQNGTLRDEVDRINEPVFPCSPRSPRAVRPGTLPYQTMGINNMCNTNFERPLPEPVSWRDYIGKELTSGTLTHVEQRPRGPSARHRVYNTILHVPRRVEQFLLMAAMLNYDACTALFTILPIKVCLHLFQLPSQILSRKRPSADQISDLLCFFIVVFVSISLQRLEISFLYHWIKGQEYIKLYVIYNMFEIVDKLCCSFNTAVLEAMLISASNAASPYLTSATDASIKLALDSAVATAAVFIHSTTILMQAITLNVAINSHSNALLTVLISNNFVEIKGNVFKKMSRENLHKVACMDAVERFHLSVCLLFVLVQNILSVAPGDLTTWGETIPWVLQLCGNACLVIGAEVLVDIVKHAFLANFNDIEPGTYSEYLQELCYRVATSQSHHVHRTLNFVPLAPACVVIRILMRLFRAVKWKKSSLFQNCLYVSTWLAGWLLLFCSKLVVGFLLQLYARAYLRRHQTSEKAHHL